MISHSSQRSRPYIVDGTLPLATLEISMVDIFYFVITPGKFNFFFSREKMRLGKAVHFSYEEDAISPFIFIAKKTQPKIGKKQKDQVWTYL